MFAFINRMVEAEVSKMERQKERREEYRALRRSLIIGTGHASKYGRKISRARRKLLKMQKKGLTHRKSFTIL